MGRYHIKTQKSFYSSLLPLWSKEPAEEMSRKNASDEEKGEFLFSFCQTGNPEEHRRKMNSSFLSLILLCAVLWVTLLFFDPGLDSVLLLMVLTSFLVFLTLLQPGTITVYKNGLEKRFWFYPWRKKEVRVRFQSFGLVESMEINEDGSLSCRINGVSFRRYLLPRLEGNVGLLERYQDFREKRHGRIKVLVEGDQEEIWQSSKRWILFQLLILFYFLLILVVAAVSVGDEEGMVCFLVFMFLVSVYFFGETVLNRMEDVEERRKYLREGIEETMNRLQKETKLEQRTRRERPEFRPKPEESEEDREKRRDKSRARGFEIFGDYRGALEAYKELEQWEDVERMKELLKKSDMDQDE